MAERAITRRAAVGAAAAGAAVLGGPAMAQVSAQVSQQVSVQASARKTFVLIHGAYHGGWCWRRVADLLEGHGHKVFAPSLTGNGDRSHLLSLDVNLDTQIADIANLITWEDLTGICLVAHSLGGWPCSGALETIHGRVASIVWLDAFKPKDGERAIDFISEHSRQATVDAVNRGEAGRAPPPAKLFSVERAGLRLDRRETDGAAERPGDAADPAHRQTRDHREEDLHPRAALSAAGVRRGAGGMPSRPELADHRQRDHRA